MYRVRSFPVASSSLAAFKEPADDISHLKANRHRNQRNGKNHHHAYSRAHIIYSVLLLCGLHIVRSLGQREFTFYSTKMTKAEKLFAAADKRDKQKMYSIIAFFAILAVSHSLFPPAFFRIDYSYIFSGKCRKQISI